MYRPVASLLQHVTARMKVTYR